MLLWVQSTFKQTRKEVTKVVIVDWSWDKKKGCEDTIEEAWENRSEIQED